MSAEDAFLDSERCFMPTCLYRMSWSAFQMIRLDMTFLKWTGGGSKPGMHVGLDESSNMLVMRNIVA